MHEINKAVAQNIRRLREQRKLSLDNLSVLTGVSKSMLAQIERGNTNPTISTVWKIADGLKIPFTQLVTDPKQDTETVALNDVAALAEDAGRYRNYPLFPFEASRQFEIYYIELDPGAMLQAAAHPEGTQEFLLVSTGTVEVEVDGQTLAADTDHAVRFRADMPHAYRNPGGAVCRLHMVIAYAQSPT